MVTLQADGSVEFSFFRPEASEMFLVGDFNGWHRTSQPMTREASGYWSCRICVPEGIYRFRYRAGGQWYVDYAAFGVECGPYGHDSIVRVERSQVTCPAITGNGSDSDFTRAASGTREGDVRRRSGESAISPKQTGMRQRNPVVSLLAVP